MHPRTLLFIHDQKSEGRMQREIDGLVSLTDSLDRYRLDLSASQIRASLDALRSAAREEYAQASVGRATVAEMISRPSWLKSRLLGLCLWPSKVPVSLPSATSQSLMVRSKLAEASRRPSGLNATQVTFRL